MTIEKNTIYDFKKEFWTTVGICKNQWENRKEDLLNWLTNFYDYELLNGRPIKIFIKEVYGDYQPLPRQVNVATKEEKLARYEEFTIASLGIEYRPNSKTRIAREALDAFGEKEYGHKSERSVAKSYIKPAIDVHGECNNHYRWCFYRTYEPMDDNTEQRWRAIMAEEKISEREAANAFYRQAEGEDISKEISFYKKAQERFKQEFGDIPVRLADWRLKREGE